MHPSIVLETEPVAFPLSLCPVPVGRESARLPTNSLGRGAVGGTLLSRQDFDKSPFPQLLQPTLLSSDACLVNKIAFNLIANFFDSLY